MSQPAPAGDGTVLTLTTWLGEVGHPAEKTAAGHPAEKTAAGYHVCLDQLAELVETDTVAQPLVAVDVEPLEERYRQLVGAD